MTRILISTFSAILLSINIYAQSKHWTTAHIGLVYPISTNGNLAKYYTNGMSFHAIGGLSYNERYFCLSGLSAYVFNNAGGCMLAGFSNHVRNEMNGTQIAGFMNTARNNTRGLQVAGFMNTTGSLKGGQVAGFSNITLDSSSGIQAAGFMNLSTKDIKGIQVAGFMNTADQVEGAQASGFMNCSEDVNTQLSGFINIARKVKGVQIAGFINIADSSDYPIGIINIVKKGQKSLGITSYDGNSTLLTFRSGGRVMYGLLGLGYHHRNGKDLYATEAGIGAHLRISKKLRLNIEGSSTGYSNFTDRLYLKSSLRAMPALSISKHLELFAGPSINHVQSDEKNGNDISPNYLWSSQGLSTFNGIYVGFFGGFHYHL